MLRVRRVSSLWSSPGQEGRQYAEGEDGLMLKVRQSSTWISNPGREESMPKLWKGAMYT